jgi:competence protein ComGC
MKHKKGGVVIAFTVLVGLFIISIAFLMFLPVVISMIDTANNMSSVAGNPSAVQLVQRIDKLWYIIPVIMIILMIIWGINRALQREPLSGY